jgi:putative membrane-bound dehydrogenase-like protein
MTFSHRYSLRFLAGMVAAWGLLAGPAPAQDAATTPKAVVNLLGDPEFKDFTMFLNRKQSIESEREKIWKMGEDGQLHITGKGWGYLRTNARYRDYHLVFEYQWGEHTWKPRADNARDCGLLVHGYGKDGAYAGTWMNSIEAQLIEGGSGDILVLAYQNRGEEKAPTRLTATVKDDRDGEPVWTPEGGESRVFPPADKMNARINWQHRDADWVDVKGFRGPKDVENPPGEWNRMEVICRGDTIRILINGVLVNEGTGANPSEGYICLQAEGAACRVRRYELWPLDQFQEPWKPAEASKDTGYTASGESILPRHFPLSPEESQAAWEIDGDYEMQLVAAEPLVCDPVDVVWDEKGRMFVAEMRDYPLPPEGEPLLSRIRLLRDRDGDGRMDEAVTWADELDHVQGLLPMQGGLLATTRTAILFLKDTDGDDRADVIRQLYISNEPGHNQLQIANPRWGLDNAIYLNNGLDGKQIYPVDQPDAKLDITRLNLRYDPRAKTLATVSGAGQFGGSLDDWGRRFFCSNRNPVMFAVMPLRALQGNPHAGLTLAQEDIQPPGAPVWPINLSHTTSVAHAGTHTAACGLGVYRGDLMPDLAGNVFVCDPTAQLVTRNRLVPNGASFIAERVGDKRDFLVSADEWSRPVNVRNGPDGALYICDMYRRYIDHARFFPEAFAKTNYMRAGFDHGRIWRLAPKGSRPRAISPLPESSADLVALLDSPNAWQRIEAQRLIVDRQDKAVVSAITGLLTGAKSPQGRVHALWTLHGLGAISAGQVGQALADAESGVVENAIELAAAHFAGDAGIDKAIRGLTTHPSQRVRMLAAAVWLGRDQTTPGLTDAFAAMVKENPGDLWLRRGILSASATRTGAILAKLLADPAFTGGEPEGKAAAIGDFAQTVGARGDVEELALVLAQVKGDPTWWQFAFVNGLGEGLRRGALPTKTVAALIAKPPAPLADHVAGLQAVLDSAESIVMDRGNSVAERLAALPLVQQQGMDRMLPLVEQLIGQSEPVEIQAAACQALSRFDRGKVTDFFFARWKTLGPTPLREALALIAASPATGLRLMEKMKAGEISPALMPPMQKWVYGRSTDAKVKALATELFGQASGDRAKIIADYQGALGGQTGDPERGKLVFQKAACMTCHQLGGIGINVGPALADVRSKPAEALLTDILDPNRAVEERWAAYTVTTRDGRQLAGLVAGETASAVEIRLPGGLSETVGRDQIASMETTGISLMPVGLDAAITKQEMVDLLAFLKAR